MVSTLSSLPVLAEDVSGRSDERTKTQVTTGETISDKIVEATIETEPPAESGATEPTEAEPASSETTIPSETISPSEAEPTLPTESEFELEVDPNGNLCAERCNLENRYIGMGQKFWGRNQKFPEDFKSNEKRRQKKWTR